MRPSAPTLRGQEASFPLDSGAQLVPLCLGKLPVVFRENTQQQPGICGFDRQNDGSSLLWADCTAIPQPPPPAATGSFLLEPEHRSVFVENGPHK